MMEQTMVVPAFGLLCLGVMAMLFIAMIVGTVVMLTSIKDQRVWNGLAKAGLITLPVLAFLLLGGIFIGTTRTVIHPAQRVEMAHIEDQQAFVERVRAQTEREVAEKLRQAEMRLQSHESGTTAIPVANNNDLRPATAEAPADALAAVPVTTSAAAVPNPAGDLRLTTRPDWLTKGTVKNGDVTTVVLASPLFATEQEAEDAVRAESLDIIEQDLMQVLRDHTIRPRTFGLFATVQHYYQKDRFVEVEQRDLGAVTAPMYRVWKKLELSPRTREQGLVLYRSEASQARFMIVGAALLALFSVPIAILVSCRGTRATHGRGKGLWRTAGGLVVLTACAVGYVWLGQHIRIFR